MRSLISIFLISLVLLTSCKKDETAEENVASAITINSPTSLGLYTNGTTLLVKGDMSDLNVLTTARVEIRNKTSGAILFQQSSSTGNVGFYSYQWSWNITGITGPTTATVKVTAKDKLGNEVSKEIDVQLDI